MYIPIKPSAFGKKKRSEKKFLLNSLCCRKKRKRERDVGKHRRVQKPLGVCGKRGEERERDFHPLSPFSDRITAAAAAAAATALAFALSC